MSNKVGLVREAVVHAVGLRCGEPGVVLGPIMGDAAAGIIVYRSRANVQS